MKTAPQEITLSEELGSILEKERIFIAAIGPFQLQNWIDWLILKTQRCVTKQQILDAVEQYGKNYHW